MATLIKRNSIPSNQKTSAASKDADSVDIFSVPAKPNKTPQRTLALPKRYVELCARSNFSFLQGASHPEEMVEQAFLCNYDGLALCDLNGLYGVARGFQAARAPSLFTASIQGKSDFKYLIGTELTLTDASQITLIPTSKAGYQNLCRLLTLGKRNVEKGFSKISLEDVAQHHQDLMAFGQPENFQSLRSIFGSYLFIPIWRDLTWDSLEHCKKAFALEKEEGAQLFVTQKPLMHLPDRKMAFDVLTCILNHSSLDAAKSILIQNSERYLRPIHDLAELWQDRIDLMERTWEIASLVHFSLDEIRYRYPESQLPEGMTAKTYLQKLTEDGLHWRYPEAIPEKVRKMAEHELGIIGELEYEDYFLTLFEICAFARQQNILHQGRGSAANSVVCFALGLTSVDPTKIDLLFERFISKERGEPPDIDIDFEHSRREEVIQHIYQKYDAQHAAMVCTVVRFKARMAIRETAKAFGVSLTNINRMIKYMGRDGMRRLVDDPDIHKKFNMDLHSWRCMLAVAQQIYGSPRHLGIHTGGFLITHHPITEIVPVEKASMQGRYVIQWNKDDVNFLKLMKIDLLSLGMLTAIQKCFALLKEHKGLDYNLATLPAEDKKTYEMIGEADTVGTFQIESRAQMNTLPRMRPTNFYDLVVEIAIIRPGPLQGGMVHPYLKRRQGIEKVHYAHPDLVPILKKTMGVPIFQEQVMRIVIAVANFTPGEADELRRVMSAAWRKKSTMEGIRARVLRGLKEHGISERYAEQIYKTIEGFANYGFPESHAASFAVLTYASCYIKCHHPDVFACALLNSQPMGFYPPRVLIADAQRHGVKFLPLDVQNSSVDYRLEASDLQNAEACNKEFTGLRAVRAGLCSIYSIPRKFLQAIENERKKGAFLSLRDFIQRTGLPKVALIKLASSGAFSCFSENTKKLIWDIESLELNSQSFLWALPRENFQTSLDEPAAQNGEALQTGSETDLEQEPSDAGLIPFESNWDRLKREYANTGFSLDQHPLSILRSLIESKNQAFKSLRKVPFASSKELAKIPNGKRVRIAGLVSVTQRPPTAKGMCFITLEDEFGFINIVIPPQIYQIDRLTIYGKSLMEIQGELQRKHSVTNVKAERVFPLSL